MRNIGQSNYDKVSICLFNNKQVWYKAELQINKQRFRKYFKLEKSAALFVDHTRIIHGLKPTNILKKNE